MSGWTWILVALMTLTLAHTAGADEPAGKPPVTRTDDVKETLHGVEVADPYRWLEDQVAPETRQWIEAENSYTDRWMAQLPGRDKLVQRATEMLKIDAVGMPSPRKGRYFFSKRSAQQDLPVLCFRQGLEGRDKVLVDPAVFSSDGSKTCSFAEISQDGELVVYGIRHGGEDEIAMKVLHVASGVHTGDDFPKARYFGVSLTPDKQTLYYTRHGADGSRVYKHTMGQPVGSDVKIFGDDYGPGQIVSPSLSEDGTYLILHVFYGSAAPKTDIYFQDLAAGTPIQPLVNDVEARFEGGSLDNRMFIKTNLEAPNGRILLADLKQPARENWKEIIPHGKGVIEDFSLVAGRLFVSQLENVVSSVRVHNLDGKLEREIQFPSLGTVSSVGGQWDGDEAFFAFSSFHIPATIYRERVSDGERNVWSRAPVPVESDKFEVNQVWCQSKDGTKVPMFLVHRKDIERNGNLPTLLYGYGGFNISLTPTFSARAMLWAENGGVFAVANLRGGGEFGEEWHQGGMLAKKQNTFDDLYACAEFLISEKYTSSSRLAIAGGSNGGLLVGTALTQRPELFRAVVCSYPLLDMIRFHKFLVARFWVPEYGSSEDEAQFKTLLSYSPYHNVKQGVKYPAVLFITGDSDTRVDPLHARKMAALLQASTGSDRPVLLRYDTKLGHTGARPVSQTIQDLSDEVGFLLHELTR